MSAVSSAVRKPVIGVIFYSTYGHVAQLAEEIIKGIEAAGAIAKPYQIQETLPAEVLKAMHAGGSLKPKYPIIDAIGKPEELKELDGFLIGAPTRYGRVPAQVSAFFDTTGQLWATGALAGKFASTFTSTASQHGGQETTHLTTMPFFAHHGIIHVPIGYTNPYLTDLAEVHGGSAYGASTVAAADGSRTPTAGELQLAKYQGEYFTKIVGQFVAGKQRLAAALAGGPQTQNFAQQGQPGQAGAQQTQGRDGSNYGTAAAAAGAGAAGAGAAGYAATHAQQGDREQTYTSTSAETPGAYNTSNPIGQDGQQGQQGYAVGGRPDETARTTGAGTGAVGTTGQNSTTSPTGATTGTTGQSTAGATGTHGTTGATGAAAGTGAGAAATGTHAGQEGTKPTTAAQEIPPSASAAATAGTGTGSTGTKPPQAQQKKKGGMFSCCSTNNID